MSSSSNRDTFQKRHERGQVRSYSTENRTQPARELLHSFRIEPERIRVADHMPESEVLVEGRGSLHGEHGGSVIR